MALFNCSPLMGNIDPLTCGLYAGGLVEIYAANFGEIDTITSSTSNNVFDNITMKIDSTTSNPYYWYQLAFKKEGASFNNEGVFGDSRFVNQSVTFKVAGLSAETMEVLQKMLVGEAVFICKDKQDVYHLLGRIAGLEVTTFTAGSGAASTDMYGAEITFLGGEPETSQQVAAGTTIDVWDGTAAVSVTL